MMESINKKKNKNNNINIRKILYYDLNLVANFCLVSTRFIYNREQTTKKYFGRKVGVSVSGAEFIRSISVIITTILAVVAFFEVAFNNTCIMYSFLGFFIVSLIIIQYNE